VKKVKWWTWKVKNIFNAIEKGHVTSIDAILISPRRPAAHQNSFGPGKASFWLATMNVVNHWQFLLINQSLLHGYLKTTFSCIAACEQFFLSARKKTAEIIWR